MNKRYIKAGLLLALLPTLAMAQNDSILGAPASDKGQLTGSFETNNIYYQSDSKSAAVTPDDRIGSNSYLKLDYYRGKLALGVQLEAYEPALLGYPTELSKAKLTNYYVTWTDNDFSVTAGTFYDQFGSGLLFRSWEDRALGLNNAVMGARFTYNYKNIVGVKAIWGTPRFGMDFSETQVRGADANFSLSELLKWNKTSLTFGASYLNRYEKIGIDLEEEGGKPYSNGFSGRIGWERNGFSLKGEYVDGGKKYYSFLHDDKEYISKHSNAQLIEAGYTGKGLGINVIGRRMEWMNNQIISGNTSTANMINYVPALCTQYTYMLTTLHPYTTQTGMLTNSYLNNGELGGEIDVYYYFRRGTALGGKRGMKVHANFSTYYTLPETGNFKTGNMLYRDFSADIEKQLSRQFKLGLLYSCQEYSPSYGQSKATVLSNIFVADMQYKFTPTVSARMELQYLTKHEDDKDWMAGLLELNFAPHWSIYGSDMYNNGGNKVHYYNVGASYARSRTRIALSYGRNKAGYVCSGGVCRTIPAYTGANLSITTSF